MIKVKILIIDDEVDFCIIMKSYFQKKNYEVFLAYNLHDGLKIINERTPDIVFLDNNLPDGEGWQYTDRIVQNNPLVKINLISAYKPGTKDLSHLKIKVWEKPISIASLEEAFPSSF